MNPLDNAHTDRSPERDAWLAALLSVVAAFTGRRSLNCDATVDLTALMFGPEPEPIDAQNLGNLARLWYRLLH